MLNNKRINNHEKQQTKSILGQLEMGATL